jgi:hypothetical protein
MRESTNATRGQKIMTESAPDRSSAGEKGGKEAVMGREFKGGRDDLSHSMNPDKYTSIAPKGGNR